MDAKHLHDHKEALSHNQQTLVERTLNTNNHVSSDFILHTTSQSVIEAYYRMINPSNRVPR